MKKKYAIIICLMIFIVNSCGSSTKTTTTLNPHAAAHNKVHQDYIKEKEQKKNNESKNLEEKSSNMEKFDTQLEGVWIINEVNNVVIDPDNFKYKKPSLELNTSKEMAVGHDGCNNFNVHFIISKETIVFDQLLSTMMACKDNIDITNAIRKILSEKELTYQIEKSQLYLMDANTKVMALSKQN